MSDFEEKVLEDAFQITKDRFRYVDVDHDFIDELIRLCAIREVIVLSDGDKPKPSKNEPQIYMNNAVFKPEKNLEPFDIVRKQIKLPSLPGIFSQIVSIMGDPNSNSKDFADVIILDPTLSARLLKLVNSSFYGFRHKIDTISDAVSIIGTKELHALVLSMSVIKSFKNIPEDFVDLTSFWLHSISCGIVARIIAEEKKFPETERFFIAGLLHDIGRLVIYKYLSGHAYKAFCRANELGEPLFQSELSVFEYDHAKLGGALLRAWKLSKVLIDMVQFHHLPKKSQNKREVSVIHLADFLVNAMKIGSSGERMVPSIDPEVVRFMDVAPNFLEALFEKTEMQIIEVMEIISPEKN